MTAAVKIGQITQSDVYAEGNQMIGRFRDVALPDIEYNQVKHETLGQIAVLLLPGRPLKELKGKLTIDFLDAELYQRLYSPTTGMRLSLH